MHRAEVYAWGQSGDKVCKQCVNLRQWIVNSENERLIAPEVRLIDSLSNRPAIAYQIARNKFLPYEA